MGDKDDKWDAETDNDGPGRDDKDGDKEIFDQARKWGCSDNGYDARIGFGTSGPAPTSCSPNSMTNGKQQLGRHRLAQVPRCADRLGAEAYGIVACYERK